MLPQGHRSFTLSYLDEDDEWIRVSSEPEFEHSWSCISPSNVIKLRVTMGNVEKVG